MSDQKRSDGIQLIYSALIGGLMASFMAVVVFSTLVNTNAPGGLGAPLAAVLIGLGSAAVFMVLGMVATTRLPWLSGGLLFAAGFTAFWSAVLSLAVERRWAVALALGVAVIMGVALGWWRFGRPECAAAVRSAQGPEPRTDA